jgi:hypothetical protein
MARATSSNRQQLIAAGILIAVVAWFITSRDPWESWSHDRFWELDRSFADPAAVYADGEYHVYTTSAKQCFPSDCPTYWVPRFTSDSLAEPGSVQGDAMPDLPTWVAPDHRAIWAPSVARIGGAYVMYFAATSGRAPYAGTKCLGVAISATPSDPFQPLPDPLRCTSGFWNLDPNVVSDGTSWFLLWREDDPANVTGKIVVAQLRPDGLGFGGEPQRTLLVGAFVWEEGYPDGAQPATRDAASTDRELPAGVLQSPTGIGPIENPAMARHPETGEWLLTWSANRWETRDYATGLARCRSPLGPCERASRDTPWLRTASDESFSTSAEFSGCGGLSFLTGPDDRLYALFHAYRGSEGSAQSQRVGWVYAVQAGGDGYTLAEFD